MKSKKVSAPYIYMAIFIAVWLFVVFGVWLLWVNVLPGIFPDASSAITEPNFITFLGAFILVRFLGVFLFGWGKK